MKSTRTSGVKKSTTGSPRKTAGAPAQRKPAVAKRNNGSSPPKKNNASAEDYKWTFRLYVAGQTPRSITAFANLKRLCEEQLAGHYNIEVIDLVKQPHLAQADQIVALPALVRKLPEPIKRIVGDLSNTDRVMVGMEIQPLAGK